MFQCVGHLMLNHVSFLVSASFTDDTDESHSALSLLSAENKFHMLISYHPSDVFSSSHGTWQGYSSGEAPFTTLTLVTQLRQSCGAS